MTEASHVQTGIEANYLGKYCLIAGLGRGGMAAVHLAVARGPAAFNKLVVVKQIHQEYAEDPEVLGMFLDEAKLAARLSHPNVVQTNEVGEEGDSHFLVMEYLDGQPLNRITHRLAKRGGLPLHLHLQVIVDLLGGLHYAHELADYDGTPLGVVHRDITPQNIFVTYDGVVKIVDFGIAKARHALTQTRIGIIKGKIAYMAPEQARSDEVDGRADIFAVGVMLWEAVTGTRPWKGVPELTLLRDLMAGRFPSVRSVKPDVPAALEAIIEKALAHDRRDRYATAAALQGALEAYLESTGERPHARDMGKLVAQHFEAERTRIKAIIESQLQSYTKLPAGAVLPLPIIDHSTSSEGENPAGQRDSTPSPQHAPALRNANTLPSASAATFAAPPIGEPTVRVPASPISSPRPWPRTLLAGTVLFAGAVMCAAIGLAGRTTSPRAEAATMVSAPPKIAATVGLRLSASPVGAQIFLDDKLLAGNPFNGQVSPDGALHRIRVEAPGFVTWSESVSLDRDRGFDIALAPDPAAPVVATSASQFAPGHGAPIRNRKLDAANPWL